MAREPHTRPLCIAVTGLPGTGKSTVARMLAQALDAVWLRSDAIRKELFPRPGYTPEETEATYAALFRRAETALNQGRSVVLDATFREQALRARVRELAERTGAGFFLVWVTAPEEQVRSRLAARRGDVSDADYAVYRALRAAFQPPGPEEHALVIENVGTPEDLAAQIQALAARLRG